MSNTTTAALVEDLAAQISLLEDNGMPVPVALFRAWEDAVEA